MTTEKIKEIQSLLNAKGYTLQVDGIAGKRTSTAIRSFQLSKGLIADGVVGKLTMAALKASERSLDDKAFERAASELGVEEAVVRAVTEVESRGSGFNSNGSVKILFEGHVFYRELKKTSINVEALLTDENKDILHKGWTKKYYNKNQWDRLSKAMEIDKDSALKSASWGMFQIMGFNHAACGFPDVQGFVEFNKKDEQNQLLLFVRYCIHEGLDGYLRDHKWSEFAKRYNGPKYKENKYDTKLSSAYKKYKK